MGFKLTSAGFKNGEAIPVEYGNEGPNASPELSWVGAPVAAKSLVLIMDDPDAPVGTFTHWIAYDIPPSVTQLPKGIGAALKSANGTKYGMNDYGKTGYGGPQPPRGHGRHRYFFKLAALDVATLGLKEGARKREVESAMRGHVIEETVIMGTFIRE